MTRPRILIADDDAELRAWLQLVLRPLQATLAVACDGEGLLELLKAAAFDVVITDIRMPPPDGLKAAALARRAGVRTPIIFITGYSDEPTRRAADALGGAVVLDKPVDADALLARVRALPGAGKEQS